MKVYKKINGIWEEQQETSGEILDLAEIRAGAALGMTSLQQSDLLDISDLLNTKLDKFITSTSIPSTGALPNTIYLLGTTDTVNITLDRQTSTLTDIWYFIWTCLSDNCTVILPSDIIIGNNYLWDIETGKQFEMCIMGNTAYVGHN